MPRLTIFHPEIDVNLMQHIPHTHGARVRQEDKSQIRRRLVKVKLIVPGPIAYEGVIVTAELADHVAQGEDGSEDELCIVGGI
jgi:hypothetical protein